MLQEYFSSEYAIFINSQRFSSFFHSKGAAQSTLQDIKVTEKAGGFGYSDLSCESKRNRFIYW